MGRGGPCDQAIGQSHVVGSSVLTPIEASCFADQSGYIQMPFARRIVARLSSVFYGLDTGQSPAYFWNVLPVVPAEKSGNNALSCPTSGFTLKENPLVFFPGKLQYLELLETHLQNGKVAASELFVALSGRRRPICTRSRA